MAYCVKCGHKIRDRAKFCDGCGVAVGVDGKSREYVYEGKLHKCSFCGGVVGAFAAYCDSCGTELRGKSISENLGDFVSKLEKDISKKKKLEIIKNYVIPNTKEDIMEFMVLACSNFDAEYYAAHLDIEDISDAWLSKIEQCYQKAGIVFPGTSDYDRIKAMHDKVMSSCDKSKKAFNKKNRLPFIVGITLLLVVFIFVPLISFIGGGGFSADPDAIKAGVSYDELEGQYYEDVVELFEKNGFTNIEAREDGWNLFHKSGTIKSVTIDGKSEFYSYSKFSKNAKIIILYYS